VRRMGISYSLLRLKNATDNSQRIASIEQSRQQSQTDPRGRIDPSRLHAALDVEGKLSTQQQILSPCALNLLGDFLKISAILWRYRSLRQNATSSLRARRTCGKGPPCDKGSGRGALPDSLECIQRQGRRRRLRWQARDDSYS
jgi:hypothetical protein